MLNAKKKVGLNEDKSKRKFLKKKKHKKKKDRIGILLNMVLPATWPY